MSMTAVRHMLKYPQQVTSSGCVRTCRLDTDAYGRGLQLTHVTFVEFTVCFSCGDVSTLRSGEANFCGCVGVPVLNKSSNSLK